MFFLLKNCWFYCRIGLAWSELLFPVVFRIALLAGQTTGISLNAINSAKKILKMIGPALSRLNSVLISVRTVHRTSVKRTRMSPKWLNQKAICTTWAFCLENLWKDTFRTSLVNAIHTYECREHVSAEWINGGFLWWWWRGFFLRWARVQSEFCMNFFLLSYEFSHEKCSEIFCEILEPLFCGSEKIPQDSRQISHQIFLRNQKKKHRRASAGAQGEIFRPRGTDFATDSVVDFLSCVYLRRN